MCVDSAMAVSPKPRVTASGGHRRQLSGDAIAKLALHALDGAEDGALLFSADGQIVLANGTLRRWLGHAAALPLDLTVADLVPALWGPAWAAFWLQFGESSCALGRHDFLCGDGSAVALELRGHRMMLDGHAYGCLFLHDPQHHDQELAEWRASLAQAERISQAKTAFLAAMSHELRTPLNAILGFSEILASELFGQLGSDRYRSYVRDIRTSGCHLLHLVNNLLDLSKIEGGHFSLDETAVSLAELIESSLMFIEPQASAGGVTLRYVVTPDLPALRGDSVRLKQILINLLANAVKFTPAGGQVTIGAHGSAAGGLELWVADTGCGMTASDLHLALLPYGQGAAGRQRQGTGLGLPLCKALAEAHDASLTLTSTLGTGTTVTIAFPPSRSVAAQRTPALPPPCTACAPPADTVPSDPACECGTVSAAIAEIRPHA